MTGGKRKRRGEEEKQVSICESITHFVCDAKLKRECVSCGQKKYPHDALQLLIEESVPVRDLAKMCAEYIKPIGFQRMWSKRITRSAYPIEVLPLSRKIAFVMNSELTIYSLLDPAITVLVHQLPKDSKTKVVEVGKDRIILSIQHRPCKICKFKLTTTSECYSPPLLQLFDLSTSTVVWSIEKYSKERVVDIAFDGRDLLRVEIERCIRFFRLSTKKYLEYTIRFHSEVHTIVIIHLPDNPMLIIAKSRSFLTNRMEAHNIETGKVLWTIELDRFCLIVPLPNGKFASSDGSNVKIRDALDDGKVTKEIIIEKSRIVAEEIFLISSGVFGVALGVSGETLVYNEFGERMGGFRTEPLFMIQVVDDTYMFGRSMDTLYHTLWKLTTQPKGGNDNK